MKNIFAYFQLFTIFGIKFSGFYVPHYEVYKMYSNVKLLDI